MLKQKESSPLSLGIFICSIAAMFYCYEYLLRIIPGVMEAELRAAFGNISATTFGTLSAYYYFAYTPMQLPAGMLIDRIGPKKLLIAACFLCALGSWFFTFTDSITIAAFGRFLVGMGSGVAFVGVLALAVFWLPEKYFSMVAGLVTMLGMIGAIGGQIGMTYIIEFIGWQEVLSAGPVVGVVLCVVMILFLKEHPAQLKRVDNANEQSVKGFLKDLKQVLMGGQVWLLGIIGALMYLSLSVFAEVWGKSYLIMAHGLSSLEASSCVSMVFFGWAVGGPLLGFLADLFEFRLGMLLVGSILAVICISLVLYVPDLSLFKIDVLLFLYGLFCSAEVIVFAIAKDASCSTLSGTVFASVNMIIMLGGVICQPLVGELLDFFWDGALINQVRVYSQADYQLVLSFLPLSLLGVAIAIFFVKEKS